MRNSVRGFTLIELMLTIAVAAVLVTVAVPGMRDFVQNNRLAAQSNEFLTTLALARSEALKRGTPVTVCRSANGASCGGSWADGWIVFIDSAASGAAPVVSELLRVTEKLDGGSVFNGPDYLRYLPSGRLENAGVQNFSLTIPDCSGDQARNIQVVPTGRAAVSRSNCS